MATYTVHADDCEMSIVDASFHCTCGAKPTPLIPPERLVEDLRWLDEHSPPLLDGWGRNRCKWGAERIEALEATLKEIAEQATEFEVARAARCALAG